MGPVVLFQISSSIGIADVVLSRLTTLLIEDLLVSIDACIEILSVQGLTVDCSTALISKAVIFLLEDVSVLAVIRKHKVSRLVPGEQRLVHRVLLLVSTMFD